jgi:hypothetical protein
LHERDHVAGAQCAQIDGAAAETFVEKASGDRSVAFGRCGRQPLLSLKMPFIAGRKIVSSCDLDPGRRTCTTISEELQELRDVVALSTPGLGENALVPAPTALLVKLDVHIAEIGEHRTALREPTVERQCVLCLDVDDARPELPIDQRTDERAEMACERTGSAADEGRGTLICAFHDVLLAGGNARLGGIAMSSALGINARSVRLDYPQRDIVRHGT